MQKQTIPMRKKYTKQRSFAPPDSPLHSISVSSDRGLPVVENNKALINSATRGSLLIVRGTDSRSTGECLPLDHVTENGSRGKILALDHFTDNGDTGEFLPLDLVTKNGSTGKFLALDHFTDNNDSTGESLPLDHVTKNGSPEKFLALDHFPDKNHVTKNGATEEPRPSGQSKNKWWTCWSA